MHAEVSRLLELQRIDGQLELIRRELQRRPDLLASQGEEVAGLQGRRAELRELRLAKKAEIDRAELEVKGYETKIADSRKHLTTVTHANEYAALESQIRRFEGEQAAIEEQLLGLWSEMEMIRNAESELDGSLGQAETDLSEDQGEFQVDLERIRAEAADLLRRRDEAVRTIDGEALDIYDLLFSRYRDQSVVSADGGVCGGCHMSLSPQVINLLKVGAELTRCDNCSRILYL